MDAKTMRLILRLIHENRELIITLLGLLLKCKEADRETDKEA